MLKPASSSGKVGKVSSSSAYEKGGSHADERLALQQEFMQFVDHTRRSTIGVCPDLAESIDHTGKISTPDSPFDGLSNSSQLLIQPESLDDLMNYGDGNLPSRLSFDFKTSLEIGKSDSRRMVSFGVANLAWFDHLREPRKIPLAVKPFELPNSERTFLHEAAFMAHCNEIGINVPKIFGVARYNDGGKGALITVFEPGLITLDNLPWGEMTTDEQDYHLQTAVETLALMHENAMFHGDAEFKNIAFKEKRSEVTLVDLEFATSLKGLPQDTHAVTEWSKKMSNDFRSVRTSLENTGVISGNDIVKYDQFFNRFIVPYFDRIQHSKSPYKKQLHAAYNRVVQAFAAEAYGEDFRHILNGIGSFALR